MRAIARVGERTTVVILLGVVIRLKARPGSVTEGHLGRWGRHGRMMRSMMRLTVQRALINGRCHRMMVLLFSIQARRRKGVPLARQWRRWRRRQRKVVVVVAATGYRLATTAIVPQGKPGKGDWAHETHHTRVAKMAASGFFAV